MGIVFFSFGKDVKIIQGTDIFHDAAGKAELFLDK